MLTRLSWISVTVALMLSQCVAGQELRVIEASWIEGDGTISTCCQSTGIPGCDDPTCEAAVCSVDSFCCNVAWDQICADMAASLCSNICNAFGGASDPCVIAGGDSVCPPGTDTTQPPYTTHISRSIDFGPPYGVVSVFDSCETSLETDNGVATWNAQFDVPATQSGAGVTGTGSMEARITFIPAGGMNADASGALSLTFQALPGVMGYDTLQVSVSATLSIGTSNSPTALATAVLTRPDGGEVQESLSGSFFADESVEFSDDFAMSVGETFTLVLSARTFGADQFSSAAAVISDLMIVANGCGPEGCGACCLSDYDCELLSEAACVAAGGFFVGDAECAENSCLHKLCLAVEMPSENSDFGHGFVRVTPSTGDEAGEHDGRGLYPQFNATILDALIGDIGTLRNDALSIWDWQICYYIDTSTYNAVKAKFEADDASPQVYNLLTHNCMHYVAEVAAIAGLTYPLMIPATGGIPSPGIFGTNLAAIGDGGTFADGEVEAWSLEVPVPPSAGGGPFDWDYYALTSLAIEQPESVALDNAWPYQFSDLGVVECDLNEPLQIGLELMGQNAITLVNWDDGSDTEELEMAFSHLYAAAGDYSVQIVVITNGGLFNFHLTASVVVGSGAPPVISVDVPVLDTVMTPNPGLEIVDPLPTVPVLGVPGDITNDGVVDVADLVEVILNWGPCFCPADIDGDGTVDVQDLISVILNWTV